MKKKTYIKLMTGTVLASTLLLGACGNKKETSQESTTAKTSQSSSSRVSTSKQKSEPLKSSATTSLEKAKTPLDNSSTPPSQSQVKAVSEPKKVQEVDKQQVASQQTSVKTDANQQATQVQAKQTTYDPTTDRKLQDKQAESNKRYKGVLTMVDGNFAAATGNWKGAKGETITVSSAGQFTVETADGKKENYSIKGYSYTLDDGKYNAEVGGGKVIQITTGADGKVASVSLTK